MKTCGEDRLIKVRGRLLLESSLRNMLTLNLCGSVTSFNPKTSKVRVLYRSRTAKSDRFSLLYTHFLFFSPTITSIPSCNKHQCIHQRDHLADSFCRKSGHCSCSFFLSFASLPHPSSTPALSTESKLYWFSSTDASWLGQYCYCINCCCTSRIPRVCVYLLHIFV